jgi:hypothetical protein
MIIVVFVANRRADENEVGDEPCVVLESKGRTQACLFGVVRSGLALVAR